MPHGTKTLLFHDHCRIGSLENASGFTIIGIEDHCRIGSLETIKKVWYIRFLDHCRIGSLEIAHDFKAIATG